GNHLADTVPPAAWPHTVHRIDQGSRYGDLAKPDGFQVRREKDPRGPEHVVPVGIGAVPVGIGYEHLGRPARKAGITVQGPDERQMNGALGEPDLIPGDPRPMVSFALEPAAAAGTLVAVRAEWIETKAGAIVGAHAAIP